MRFAQPRFSGLILGLLVLASPGLAHHGTNISYDHNKPTTLNGTVTEFVWSNPHCQLYFDVKDAGGKTTNWAGELNSPIGGFAAGILDVEIQLAMRIAPYELRHSTVQGRRLVMVVRNVRPVMCKTGARKHEQPQDQAGKPWLCKSHFVLLIYSADSPCGIPHALVERLLVHRCENVFDEIPGRRVRLKPPHELDASSDRLRIHLWIRDDDG